MWAEWLLPCIPNTCKITGATQRPFPTTPLYNFSSLHPPSQPRFLYQSSPVSTSFSLSVVDHLILWGLRLRVGNLVFFHRCSSFSQRVRFTILRGLFRFASTWLFASQSPSNWLDCDLPPSPTSCVTEALQARTVSLFTVHHTPSNSHLLVICLLDHWTHLDVIQLETAP